MEGLNDAFEDEVFKISKNEKIMSIREAVIENFKDEGREEGVDLGVEKTLEVFNRLKKGDNIETIAKDLKLKLEMVEKIQKSLLSE